MIEFIHHEKIYLYKVYYKSYQKIPPLPACREGRTACLPERQCRQGGEGQDNYNMHILSSEIIFNNLKMKFNEIFKKSMKYFLN